MKIRETIKNLSTKVFGSRFQRSLWAITFSVLGLVLAFAGLNNTFLAVLGALCVIAAFLITD